MKTLRGWWGGLFLCVLALADPARGAAPATVAWRDLEQLIRTVPDPEARLSGERPGAKEAPHFFERAGSRHEQEEALVNHYTLLKFRLEDFVAAYPGDKHHAEARVLLLQVTSRLAAGLGQELDAVAVRRELAEIEVAPGTEARVRASAAYGWIEAGLAEGKKGLPGATLAELINRMEKFPAAFPRDWRAGNVALMLGEILTPRDAERAARAYAMAAKVGSEEIAAKAEGATVALAYRRAPLDLVFTAVDGRKVDLATLRGKYVLLDFWATWCPPCRDAVPSVVAAYHQFHDRGFEIVGVSLDESKSALTAYTKAHGMSWPQYFDGGGWETKVSRRFKITSVPAMWLFGPDGRLLDADVRGQLAEKLAKLLPP